MFLTFVCLLYLLAFVTHFARLCDLFITLNNEPASKPINVVSTDLSEGKVLYIEARQKEYLREKNIS